MLLLTTPWLLPRALEQVSEGTVEERIQKRAEGKLYLDQVGWVQTLLWGRCRQL